MTNGIVSLRCARSAALSSLSSLGGLRGQLGDRPRNLERPGWPDGLARSAGRPAGAAWAPRARSGRPCWLDPASIGSLWLPLAPLLARFGLVWLDLAAPAALAGSICLPWSALNALTGSIWLQTTAPTTRLAKKSDLLIDDLPRRCLLRSLWNVSSCLKSSRI